MDRMLRQLETFAARGSDGRVYRVCGYEHLARLDDMPDLPGGWEPTGLAEYRLDDGRAVHVARDGTMVLDSGVMLERRAA